MSRITGHKKASEKLYYLVFIAILCLYLLTMATTISAIGGGPELIVASYNLGIAHPPGYPLYTMVGHLFTYIPLSNIACRLNLFSLLFSLLSLIIGYEILKKLLKNSLAAIITISFLSVTKLFWEYSLSAEVDALNYFFIFLLIYLLMKWGETGSKKIFYWFCFIFGLSLTHHHTVILLAPGFLLFIFQNWKKAKKINWFLTAPVFILGLLPYLYLPIAASLRPLINWDDPSNFRRFMHMILRDDFPRPSINLEHFFDWKYGQIYLYATTALKNLTLPGILLGLIGIFTGTKAIKKHYWMLLTVFICTSIIFISLFGYTQDAVVINVIQKLYVYSFLIFVIFIGVGLLWLNKKVKSRGKIAYLACIPLIIILFAYNYSKVDRYNNLLLYNFTGNMLKSYPPKSILIVSGDTLSMGLDYHQMVEKHRRDVIVVDQEKMTYPWYCEQKREQEPELKVPFPVYNGTTHPIAEFVEANYEHHKIYVTGPRDPSLDKDYVMLGQGLLRVLIKLPASVSQNAVPASLIRIEEKKAENDIIWKNFDMKDAVLGKYEPLSFEGEIVTIYAKARFNQGWAYDFNKKYDWAIKEYEKAIKIDPSFPSPYKNLGILYLNALNRPDMTVQYWNQYLRMKNVFETDMEAPALQQELERLRKYITKK